METIIHRAEERGKADYGWLHTKYSFSFNRYYDPEKMGFGLLRVLNDDIVESGMGFGTHPHDNMEIITIILEGALEHKDSMGNGSVIYKDEVQVMSAGTGITHSEFNPSKDKRVALLQIWIIPNEGNIKPRYDQNKFPEEGRKNQVKLVVAGKNEDGTLMIHQDAALSLGHLEKGKTLNYSLHYKNNGIYLFLIDGELKIEEEELFRRDAIGISGTETIKIEAQEESRFVIIEVPMS